MTSSQGPVAKPSLSSGMRFRLAPQEVIFHIETRSRSRCLNDPYGGTHFHEIEMWIATEFVNFSQPTIQPTTRDVLYDFRVFWQSPRSCKL